MYDGFVWNGKIDYSAKADKMSLVVINYLSRG